MRQVGGLLAQFGPPAEILSLEVRTLPFWLEGRLSPATVGYTVLLTLLVGGHCLITGVRGDQYELADVPEKAAKDPAIARAQSALALADVAPANVETAALEQRIETNPDDHEARYELAGALMASDRDAAADHLLEIVRRDREWNEGAARARLLHEEGERLLAAGAGRPDDEVQPEPRAQATDGPHVGRARDHHARGTSAVVRHEQREVRVPAHEERVAGRARARAAAVQM